MRITLRMRLKYALMVPLLARAGFDTTFSRYASSFSSVRSSSVFAPANLTRSWNFTIASCFAFAVAGECFS
jgi:hypothetical protein